MVQVDVGFSLDAKEKIELDMGNWGLFIIDVTLTKVYAC